MVDRAICHEVPAESFDWIHAALRQCTADGSATGGQLSGSVQESLHVKVEKDEQEFEKFVVDVVERFDRAV